MNYLLKFSSILLKVLLIFLLTRFCECNQTLIRVKRLDDSPKQEFLTVGVSDREEEADDTTIVETVCSREFKSESHKLHRMTQCRTPRKKIVPLKMSSMLYMPGAIHLPHSYEVERCDGGVCDQTRFLNHKCLAIKKEMIEVPIFNRLVSGHSRGSPPVEKCMRVKIERHIECGCRCAMTEKNCNERQRFSPDRCACECMDMSMAGTCALNNRMWSNERCECVCPPTVSKVCSSGAIFDDKTCRCIETKR